MGITDNKFIGQETPISNLDDHAFTGIADPNKWSIEKVAELIGSRETPAEDDPLPAGTRVEFSMPNSNEIRCGVVASKCGNEYVVQINEGESCLVPPGRLAKIDNASKIAEVLKHELMPRLELQSEISKNGNHVATVEFKDRYPSDNQIIKWSLEHFPDLKLVDAIQRKARRIDLIFEVQAAEDVKPQGGDSFTRAPGLMSQEIDGTGVIGEASPLTGIEDADIDKGIEVEKEHTEDEELARQIAVDHLAEDPDYYNKLEKMEKHHNKKFALKDITVPSVISLVDVTPKQAQAEEKIENLTESDRSLRYQELHKAAEWTLGRFNDSNPGYYAAPQEIGMIGSGGEQILQLFFSLKKKGKNEELGNLYFDNKGIIVTAEEAEEGFEPVNGYVQVDSDANLPIVMLSTPHGMESAQKYSFNFTATMEYSDDEIETMTAARQITADVCACLADTVLSEHGGYSAKAQADFEARLTKLAVDPSAKSYWSGYFKDYGKMLTRDIPRKIKKKKADSDYTAYVDKVDGGYEVKSKKNPKWSGGTYKSKSKAEERLGEVEMFKHMKDGSKYLENISEVDWIDLATSAFTDKSAAWWNRKRPKSRRPKDKRKDYPKQGPDLSSVTNVVKWSLEQALDEQDYALKDIIIRLGTKWINDNPGYFDSINDSTIGEAYAYELRDNEKSYNLIVKFLKDWDKRRTNWEHKELGKQRKQEKLDKLRGVDPKKEKETWEQQKDKEKKEKGGPIEMGGATPQIQEEGPVEMGKAPKEDVAQQYRIQPPQPPQPTPEQIEESMQYGQQYKPPFRPVAKTAAGLADLTDLEWKELTKKLKGKEEASQALEQLKQETSELEKAKGEEEPEYTIPEGAKVHKAPRGVDFTSWEVEPERPESRLTTPNIPEPYGPTRGPDYAPPEMNYVKTMEQMKDILRILEEKVEIKFPSIGILKDKIPIINPDQIKEGDDLEAINEYAGAELWLALFLSGKEGPEKYKQYQDILKEYHPELFITYKYQTLGTRSDEALEIHDNIEKSLGRKVKPIEGFPLDETPPNPIAQPDALEKLDREYKEKTRQVDPELVDLFMKKVKREHDPQAALDDEYLKILTDYLNKNMEGGFEAYLSEMSITNDQFANLPIKKQTSLLRERVQELARKQQPLKSEPKVVKEPSMEEYIESTKYKRPSGEIPEVDEMEELIRILENYESLDDLLKRHGLRPELWERLSKEEQISYLEGAINKHMEKGDPGAAPGVLRGPPTIWEESPGGRGRPALPSGGEDPIQRTTLPKKSQKIADEPEMEYEVDSEETADLPEEDVDVAGGPCPNCGKQIETLVGGCPECGITNKQVEENRKIELDQKLSVYDDANSLIGFLTEKQFQDLLTQEGIDKEQFGMIEPDLQADLINDYITGQYGDIDPRKWKNKVSEFDLQLALDFLDPQSDVRVAYDKFLNWVPTTWGKVSKDPVNHALAKAFAGAPIKEIINNKQWGHQAIQALTPTLTKGNAKLAYFALKAHDTDIFEVEKEKRRKTRRDLKTVKPEGTFLGEPMADIPLKDKKKKVEPHPGAPMGKRDVTLVKKPSKEEAQNIPVVDAFWMHEVPEGAYKGEMIINALQKAEGDEFLDLQNIMRLKSGGVWAQIIEHRLGPEAARSERAFIQDLQAMAKEDVKAVFSMNLKTDEYLRGMELLKKINAEDKPLLIQDAIDIALDFKENDEPGVLSYLMHSLKQAKGEDAEEKLAVANDYLRTKGISTEEKTKTEEEKRQLVKRKHPTEVQITQGPPGSPWFKSEEHEGAMGIDEAFNASVNWPEDKRVSFFNILQRWYPIQLATYQKWISGEEKREEEEARTRKEEEAGEKRTEEEKAEEKIQKEREELKSPEEIEKAKKRMEEEEVETKTPGKAEEVPGKVYEQKEPSVDKIQKAKERQEDLNRILKDLEKKGAVMQKHSDAGPGPQSYNAPGKDDKKDYDHQEMNKQPARSHNKFIINRMFSTTSSDDNGYVMMDIGWDPELFKNMSPQNIQHQIISFIKGLESDKYFHDFGIMGKPKIIDFDEDAGVAQIKVRCSESRGIMTLTYGGELKDDVLPLTGIR